MANVDVSTPDFGDLCRLCATKTSISLGIQIFEYEGDTRQICRKIKECLPVQVTSTDKLPKMVCEECVYKLDLLSEFREKSLETESYLADILRSAESAAQSAVETKKCVEPVLCESTSIAVPVSVPESSEVPISTPLSTPTLAVPISASLSSSAPESATASALDPPVVSAESEPSENASMQIPIQEIVKCEPDLFIKEECEDDCLGDPESDRESETEFGNETYTESDCIGGNEKDSVSLLPEHDSQPDDGSASGRMVTSVVEPSTSQIIDRQANCAVPPVANNASPCFINPAANGLLLLFCPQTTAIHDQRSWFFCNVCRKTFVKSEEFHAHYESHFCKCSICGTLCTNEDALNTHCKNVHPQSVTINPTPSEDGEKSSRRSKWEPKVCPECGEQYQTNYKLTEHMRKHTGEKPFKCSTCSKAFRVKFGLAQHEAKHKQYDYTCNTCGRGFQCKSYLIVHQRVHSDHRPHPCSTCGSNFKTKRALMDHQNRHLGVKPYLCETCGQRFTTKGLCKSHQRVHSGKDNKQFPCSVCNKFFVSKSSLTIHQRIHTGERPYMCEVCGKSFSTSVELRVHSTMHTGEKSFVCEWCGKAFARRYALCCHRRSHTGERPYHCDICGQSFTQFSPLKIHKRLHTGERPYACDICEKAFVSRSTMMAHKKKHTS